ncbi:MAG: RNase adapter RapZ [Acidobacteria bacterium]|nr:RNase adapter RapZ [Acidobacteriota bacterium]
MLRPASSSRFIVLTGLSGSGKSQAIRALEDLGYFCVDNLPTTLIPTLADLSQRAGSELSKIAVVVDVRERTFLSEFPAVFKRLRATRGLSPVLIFLDASDSALVRRFSETRRPHPLASNRSVIEGIREERARLGPIRRMADQIVDTSDLTVHELRQAFLGVSRGSANRTQLVVTILSFGFKHGIPLDSDLVFDVRFLPNPHFVPGLRKLSGKDGAVKRYLDRSASTKEFIDRTAGLLRFLVPQYVSEGKSYLTIAVGCTGGRHRSVAIAEALAARLTRMKGIRLRVRHRDMATA